MAEIQARNKEAIAFQQVRRQPFPDLALSIEKTKRLNVFASCQRVEQRPSALQVGGVKALGEPAVDWREDVVRLGTSALIAPQPGEAGRRPEFPHSCILSPGDCDGPMEAFFSVAWISPRQCHQQIAFDAVEFCFHPTLAGPCNSTEWPLKNC
jgi:hypothetical protein